MHTVKAPSSPSAHLPGLCSQALFSGPRAKGRNLVAGGWVVVGVIVMLASSPFPVLLEVRTSITNA